MSTYSHALAMAACMLSASTGLAQMHAVATGSTVDAPFVDIRWQPRRLSEFGPRAAFVVYFATVECPMVRRYMPRIGEVASEYLPRDVVTIVANVGAGDAFVDAAAQVVEFAPHAFFAKDQDLELARACGVDRSGAVVVLDRGRRLRYRGRVDDQHGYSVSREQASHSDLRRAIDEVLAARPVSVPETAVVGCRITAASLPSHVPGYTREIAPLLAKHCIPCHSAEARFPFSLVGEANVRKHAAMIGEVVTNGRMPPWTAAANSGPFLNRRGLSLPERELIRGWLGGGMPLGDGPAFGQSMRMPAEWTIGSVHAVIEAREPVTVPEVGAARYHEVVFSHHFASDTWVEAMELRSRGGAPMHHANFAIVMTGERYTPDAHVGNQVMHGRAVEFEAGTALRVPAGAKLVAQLYYVPNGRASKEQVQVALRFPRIHVKREVRIGRFGNEKFRIPPGAASFAVAAEWSIPDEAIGISIFVQMHLRGRDVTIFAETPDGNRQPILVVPNYSFATQEGYVWWRGSTRWPRGTRFQARAHFDNSAWNTSNPDPSRWVEPGPTVVEERMNVALTWVAARDGMDLAVDPRTGTAIEAAEDRNGRNPR